MNRPLPSDLPRACLKRHIQSIFSTARLWACSSSPQSILALAIYKMGSEHATSQIASGSSPDWHINDIFTDCTDMLAYIRVEQLKLQRSMGGDTDKFNVLKIRERAGFPPHMTPEEDPEPFDESTGPMPPF